MCTKPVYRIAVFTGSRAEYGLLKNIMGMIASDSALELVTLVSGSHLEDKFGHTIDEIIQDGFKIDYEIPMNLSSDTTDAIIHSIDWLSFLNQKDLICLSFWETGMNYFRFASVL